ncbi:class A beta-lactamase [Labedella endophytica]|uniref:Beta-lactamase n=1 Tax=Labedella endophytica TaxID=1523160 RepID=A0A3S0WZC7_9MICO|nr:class A beta-lactamase [Labedella endophytica]RUR01823.1 class A beta-lactamase [Labedella endophytica]
MTRTTSRSRGSFIASFGLALLVLAGCTTEPEQGSTAPSSGAPTSSPSAPAPATDAAFSALESEFDARLGVYALDTGTGEEVVWRADERFAFASTYKALAAGAVLDQVGIEGLDTSVMYGGKALVEYSPITEKYADIGMTIGDLADAALRYSDNTAGNMLFEVLGGPTGFDTALEALGDDVTESVREETELNAAERDETLDTSTPTALATDLRAYLLGDVLSDDERAVLTDWMVRNTTGDTLVRAGVPDDWTVADKSGSAKYGTRNDIAVVWPTDGDPIVLAILSDRDTEDAERDDALIARATEEAVAALR